MLVHTGTKPQPVLKVTQRLAWSCLGNLGLQKPCRTFQVTLKWTEIHPGAAQSQALPARVLVSWLSDTHSNFQDTFPGFMPLLKGQVMAGLVKIPLQCQWFHLQDIEKYNVPQFKCRSPTLHCMQNIKYLPVSASHPVLYAQGWKVFCQSH